MRAGLRGPARGLRVLPSEMMIMNNTRELFKLRLDNFSPTFEVVRVTKHHGGLSMHLPRAVAELLQADRDTRLLAYADGRMLILIHDSDLEAAFHSQILAARQAYARLKEDVKLQGDYHDRELE